MLENLLTGIVGTIVGIVLGTLTMIGLFMIMMADMMADFDFVFTLGTNTVLLAILVGVGMVALTPLIAVRRMARMDIPATLRVME